MLPAGFVFYPASAHSIAEMAKEAARSAAHDGDGRRAVLLMDTSSECGRRRNLSSACWRRLHALLGGFVVCFERDVRTRDAVGIGLCAVRRDGRVDADRVGSRCGMKTFRLICLTFLLYELLPELQGKI